MAPASYDAANELTNWNGTAISYDANGNMLSDGSNAFTWNARDQVAALNGVSLQYDGAGRRIKNKAGTSFLFDGPNAAQELSGSTVTANLLSGGVDELFTRSDSSGSFTPLQDALGSTIALVDSSGNLQTTYSYDPFGNTALSGAANGNPSQYAGRENEGNGLYFYRNRYYSPLLGRFVSEDPLGFGGGINLYRYALDSPLTYRDPWGLQSDDDLHAQAEECARGENIYCVHSPEEIQQMRADRERERPPDLSGRYTSHPPEPPQSPCAPMNGFSNGVSVSAVSINPFTSQGGGVWGANGQRDVDSASWYSYKGTGLGLDVGVSAQLVGAWGSGPWTDNFHSFNVSYGLFAGSIFWTPGKGGWTGASFGPALGLPGAAYEETHYTCEGS